MIPRALGGLCGATLLCALPAVLLAAPCPAPVYSGIARADAAVGASVVPVACPDDGGVLIRLETTTGDQMRVEITPPQAPAFRRFDHLGLSPVVQTDDFEALPQPLLTAFGELESWAAALPGPPFEQAWQPAPTPRKSRSGLAAVPWLWLLGLAGLWMTRRGEGRAPEPSAAALLFVLGAGLRLGLGPWAPHHVNGHGPRWIELLLPADHHIPDYGPGFVELHALPQLISPLATDTTVFLWTALLGAAVGPVALAVARAADQPQRRARLWALLAAVEPVSLRMGATESYFPPLLLGTLLCTLALLRQARSGGWRAGAGLVAAAAIGSATARIHPLAWPLLASTPLAVTTLGGPPRLAARRVLRGALGLAAITAVLSGPALWATYSDLQIPGRSGMMVGGPWHLPELGPLLAALAFLLAIGVRRASRPLFAPTAAALALGISTADAFAQSELWRQSYLLLFAPWPALAALAAVGGDGWRRAVASGALLALVVLPRAHHAVERTTAQQEYRWVSAQLDAVEEPCTLVWLQRTRQLYVELPTWRLTAPQRRSHLRLDTPDELPPWTGGCVLYLHSSLCSVEHGECGALERRLELIPRAHTELPARPNNRYLRYADDPVPVTLYTVRSWR